MALAALPLMICCAACGTRATASNREASKPASQALKDAALGLRRTHSVRIAGHTTIDKQRAVFSFELKPPNMSVEFDRGAASFHVMLIGRFAYVKANSTFLTSSASPRARRVCSPTAG
jgi:hypothetical protein